MWGHGDPVCSEVRVSFLSFDDSYRLGHEEIDGQHQKLVNAINHLYDAMMAGQAAAEMGKVLGFLRAYTVKHFEFEEALMEESGYPGYESHRAIHDELTEQVVDLERRYLAGNTAISLSLFNFLKEWLVSHIADEDRRLVEFLNSRDS